MRQKRKFLMAFAVLIFCIGGLVGKVDAALIKIGIEAVVNYLHDANNLLESKVAIGSTITGTYTYDTSTPDTNPSLQIGEYFYNDAQCGINWTIGEVIFKTNPDSPMFMIGIADNYIGHPGDGYWINSSNNSLLSNGVDVDRIAWQLDDYDGTAISSTALPTTAPILTDWDYSTLSITGGIGGTAPCYTKTFDIGAEVTSAFLIPEPMSVLLFGFGLLALRKQKK